MASALKFRNENGSNSNLSEKRNLYLDSDDSSNYGSYVATVSTENVDSDQLGELDDKNTGEVPHQVNPSHLYELNFKLPIPDGAMGPTDKFEVEMFQNIEVGESFEAFVSHVTDPFDFYIQLRSIEHIYRKMMNDLEVFYRTSESSKYQIRGIEPGICGLPCAALYCNAEGKSEGWHRAIIIEIYDLDTVGVFYVDYGTKSRIGLFYCRFLDKRFGKENAQAINVKCGGIKSTLKVREGESCWSSKACTYFKQWVDATNLASPLQGVVAILMSNVPNRKPELILYDTVTNDLPDGIIINEALIVHGLAKRDKKWQICGGLLPWQFPDEQLGQLKKKNVKETNTKTEIKNAHKSPEEMVTKTEVKNTKKTATVELDDQIPSSRIKQSVDTVTYWFDNLRVPDHECSFENDTSEV